MCKWWALSWGHNKMYNELPKSYIIKQKLSQLNNICTIENVSERYPGAQISYKETLRDHTKDLQQWTLLWLWWACESKIQWWWSQNVKEHKFHNHVFLTLPKRWESHVFQREQKNNYNNCKWPRKMTLLNTHFNLPSTKSTLSWKMVSLVLVENKLNLKCFWKETTTFYLWSWATVVPHLSMHACGVWFASWTGGTHQSP